MLKHMIFYKYEEKLITEKWLSQTVHTAHCCMDEERTYTSGLQNQSHCSTYHETEVHSQLNIYCTTIYTN